MHPLPKKDNLTQEENRKCQNPTYYDWIGRVFQLLFRSGLYHGLETG